MSAPTHPTDRTNLHDVESRPVRDLLGSAPRPIRPRNFEIDDANMIEIDNFGNVFVLASTPAFSTIALRREQARSEARMDQKRDARTTRLYEEFQRDYPEVVRFQDVDYESDYQLESRIAKLSDELPVSPRRNPTGVQLSALERAAKVEAAKDSIRASYFTRVGANYLRDHPEDIELREVNFAAGRTQLNEEISVSPGWIQIGFQASAAQAELTEQGRFVVASDLEMEEYEAENAELDRETLDLEAQTPALSEEHWLDFQLIFASGFNWRS